jgi:hypothetical protein
MKEDEVSDTHGINPYAAKSDSLPQDITQSPADAVPAGTLAEILAWVGSDPDRAEKALAAERAGHGRKTLISRLEGLSEQ